METLEIVNYTTQLTLSQIEVPTSRTFSGRSSAFCWEPLLACPQVSTPSQMARVKGRIKKWRPPSVVWCHPTPCPRPNSWFGWNMPITFLSAQPQAFPPSSVPTGISLHCSLPSKRKPPAHQCRPSCNASAPGKKPATLSNAPTDRYARSANLRHSQS